jgi:hypothetical protein
MQKNGFFLKIVSGIFQVILVLALMWGEFAGIYHAFAHHSTRAGFIAVFIPPIAWYRSIDFVFWIIKGGGLSGEEKDEIGHFIESINLTSEAINMLNEEISKSPNGIVAKEIEDECIRLVKESLKESRNVRDEVLSKLNEDLPVHYRDEFCKGSELYFQGLSTEDVATQVKGVRLLTRWDKWCDIHLNEILSKYYGKEVELSPSEIESNKAERKVNLTEAGWPEFTVEELDKVSEIMGKAMQKPLQESDLERLRKILDSYHQRVGRLMQKEYVDLFISMMEIPIEYNYELGKCLLYSVDSKDPYISNELRNLRAEMEMLGTTDKKKLDSDFKRIRATGIGEPWEDEFGITYEPLTREEVLAGIKETDMMKENFKKVSIILREFIKQKP